MFPLQTKSLPLTAESLRDALEQSLRRVVAAPSQIVTVIDQSYPELKAILVSVDHARALWRRPEPLPRIGKINPALRVESLRISGHPIFIEQAAIDLTCTAREAEIGQACDHNGDLVLVLQNATEGTVEIAAAVADLEALVLVGARAEAKKHGVTLEQVQLTVNSRTSRTLSIAVQVRARKLLLRATVRLSGEVEIDDRLNVRLSGLRCAGEGPLGSFACSFLGPHLERFNHREFPLLALPLGQMELRDIKIAADNRLAVSARFGRKAA